MTRALLGFLTAGRRAGLLVVVGMIVAALFALRSCDETPFAFGGAHVESGGVRVDLRSDGARIVFGMKAGRSRLPINLRLRDGNAFVPLPLGRAHRVGNTLEAPVLLAGGGKTRSAKLVVAPSGTGVVNIDLVIEDPALSQRELALAFEAPIEGKSIFVSDVGELADLGEAKGRLVVLGEDPFALGVASSEGDLSVSLTPEPHEHVGAPKVLRLFGPVVGDRKKLSLVVAPKAATQAIYGALWSALGVKTARVRGVVGGAAAGTRLYGLDDAGRTRLRAIVGTSGRFEVDVPPDVNRWYAAVDESRTSPPLFFEPGANWDLKLDVSPGGELVTRVRNADGDAPLVARIAVRGAEGTLDPSFGPDYRASGAGPLVDSRSGEVTTPIPSGRYRVSATKGIEWSIDAKEISIEPGSRVVVDLALRHVVPTPGLVGCDLHVHARPSFDSPVMPEDRVLSLVAAGIEFAVPTEHNLVGDYGPALAALSLESELGWVPGVEVTTYTPRFGHFGVFPMAVDAAVPPYRRTTPGAVFAHAHRDPKRVLQVNHPRLPKDIGYFEVAGFHPEDPRTLSKIRLDFDAVEVYSGFDVQHPARVETVLADYYALLKTGRHYVATGSSDAHRIQYNWAGYPRTMVRLDDEKASDDPNRVVESLKKGHAIVTSGPMIDFTVENDRTTDATRARPGDEIELRPKSTRARIRVHAAPWIDVTELELIADGKTIARADVASRPSVTGPENGTFEEAQARTLRHEVTFDVPDDAHWVIALARGKRTMDDVLAFMPIVPFAFTNPIWLKP